MTCQYWLCNCCRGTHQKLLSFGVCNITPQALFCLYQRNLHGGKTTNMKLPKRHCRHSCIDNVKCWLWILKLPFTKFRENRQGLVHPYRLVAFISTTQEDCDCSMRNRTCGTNRANSLCVFTHTCGINYVELVMIGSNLCGSLSCLFTRDCDQ